MKKRLVLIAFLLTAAAMVCTAIGGSEPKTPPTTLSGEVEFLTFWAGGVEAEATEAIIEAFNKKYPDVKVTVIPKPSDNIMTSINLNLSSSAPVDCFMFWAGPGLRPLIDAGQVAPLTDIFEKLDYDTTAQGVKSQSRFDDLGDMPWCLPITTGSFQIFYNLNVWEKAGLDENDIPRTWSEFLQVCEKIKATGVAPLVRNIETAGTPARAWAEKLLDRTAGAEYTDGLAQGTASYDDDRFRKADDLWDDIREYWHTDVGVMQYNEAYMAFARGEAAMQLIGSWIIGSYETEMGLVPGEDYSAFAFPQIDRGVTQYETYFTGNALVLSTHGAENEAAKEFLAFWGTKEAQDIFASFVPGLVAVEAVTYQSPILAVINEELAGRPTHMMFVPDSTIDSDVVKVFEKRALGAVDQETAIAELEKLRASVR